MSKVGARDKGSYTGESRGSSLKKNVLEQPRSTRKPGIGRRERPRGKEGGYEERVASRR